MSLIFQQLINAGIMKMYIDDIVVFGQIAEECLSKMERVLKQAQQYGFDIR